MPADFGDLVDSRAAKPVNGEDIERRLEDLLFLLFLDARSPLRPARLSEWPCRFLFPL